MLIDEFSKEIDVSHSYLQGGDWNIGIRSGSHDVRIIENNFYGGNWGVYINNGLEQEANVEIIRNEFMIQNNASVGTSYTRGILVDGNNMNTNRVGIYSDNTRDLLIKNNLISILSIDGWYNSGIHLEGGNDTVKIFNNYIKSSGIYKGEGILLQNSYNVGVFFNTLSMSNTDIGQDSKGIYINGGYFYEVRNNVSCINTAGYPVHATNITTNFSLDYNDYYHPEGLIGNYSNSSYYSLDEWGQAVNGDANSKNVNPYFASEDNPLPYQRALNGAGIPVSGVLLDINGLIRNDQAPDIGCVEFTVDFGVTDLLSPNLDCVQSQLEDVTVYLRQFGDIPFIDLKLAYRVNNGPVQYDTIPGAIFNDIVHTFSTPVNISADGEYLFKIWLINALDDNINNDTLYTTRYSKPAPQLSASFDNTCTWNEVFFTGSAEIAAPYFIQGYEWEFGDSTFSLQQNPVHVYENPGTYQVLFRVYSNAGCYSEQILQVLVDPDYEILGLNLDITNEVCLGDGTGSVALQATGGTPPFTYFMNGEPMQGPQALGIPAGTYAFTVKDATQCEASGEAILNPAIYMNPVIINVPDTGFAPLEITFEFQGNNVASCLWDFGNGQTSTEFNPVHTFNSYGDEIIVLTVNSGEPNFCEETDTVTIFVDVNIIIDPNNVFTPNGDSLNDYFEVRTNGIRDLNVKIYDQWGDLVYEITSVSGKWNGNTESGKEAPEGVYFYYITATGFNEMNFDRRGSVMLLRDDSEIYPNPVSGMLKLKPGGLLSGKINIEIFNVQGYTVYAETMNKSEEVSIDISGLNEGFYILRACDKGDCIFKRIIKK
jgi:gliding motility-associated-like protein